MRLIHFNTLPLASGEIFELKAELNSDKKERKKEAVKKVIASMTVGKDVRSVLSWFVRHHSSLNVATNFHPNHDCIVIE